MKINHVFLCLALCLSIIKTTFSQRVVFRTVSYQYDRLPLLPLPKEITTYCPLITGITEMIKLDLISQYMQLEHLKRVKQEENPDILLIVDLGNGFEKIASEVQTKKVETVDGNNITTIIKYYCEMKYIMPFKYKIITKEGTELAKNIYSDNEKVYIHNFPEFYSYTASQNDYIENKGKTMIQLQQNKTHEFFQKLNKELSSNHTISPITLNIVAGRAEGNENKYDYTDLDKAYGYLVDGVSKVNAKNMEEAKEVFLQAINLFENALKESNLVDKKARINEKITSMIHYDIGLMHLFMNDFDKADYHLTIALSLQKGFTDEFAETAIKLCEDQKKRFKANGLL